MVNKMNVFGNSQNVEGVRGFPVYHASNRIVNIEDIMIPGPRSNCDFGLGFYLAERKQTAEEWVIRRYDPIVNEYRFTFTKENILHLVGEDWIRVIVGYRTGKFGVRFRSPIIYGAVADDRVQIALNDFMAGRIGDKRLYAALDYCKLGNQYLLRSKGNYLSEHLYKNLVGLELSNAVERASKRRQGMADFLRKLIRNPIKGEKYIEEYETGGDFIEQ